jgi:hypothetical protein
LADADPARRHDRVSRPMRTLLSSSGAAEGIEMAPGNVQLPVLSALSRRSKGNHSTGTLLITRAQSSAAVPAGKASLSSKKLELASRTMAGSSFQAAVCSCSPSRRDGVCVCVGERGGGYSDSASRSRLRAGLRIRRRGVRRQADRTPGVRLHARGAKAEAADWNAEVPRGARPTRGVQPFAGSNASI